MSYSGAPPPPPTPTTITCGDCGKEATVPFQPTPGRPVYCRDCFSKHREPRAAPSGGGGGFRGPPRTGGFGGDSRPSGGYGGGGYGGGARYDSASSGPARASPTQRRRMLKQGAKAHFRYDLRDVLSSSAMDENQVLSFSETVFSKGSRISSDDAMAYVDSKVADATLTAKDGAAVKQLIHRYSMWR